MADEQDNKMICGEGFWVIHNSHFSLWELPPGSAFSVNSPIVIDRHQFRGGNIIRIVKTDPETGWIQAETMVPQTLSEHIWVEFWISIDDMFRLERNAKIGNYAEGE